mmetsp:Transcript_11540/g.24610  ORF Transcript_11540/g.24610 Transcript_11540/m.24610 type:complete len:953 (-) Transcript_11540:198-3056(-)
MLETTALLNGARGDANGDYGSPSSPLTNTPASRGSQNLTTSPFSPTSPVNIDTSSTRQRRSSIAAMAAAEVILHDREIRKSASSRKLENGFSTTIAHTPLVEIPSMESMEADEVVQNRRDYFRKMRDRDSPKVKETNSALPMIHNIIGQLPAIAIASVLNLMIGIPFGASYFPPELPLPGKEVLGLRVFLFSTMAAQTVYTFKSKFTNGVGLQMVENVPFCLELARIVIDEQGSGTDAASTLFFLFGLSSCLVGLVFYLLGRYELGRIVYFFPSHVLVGCIGGIGAFIIVTSLEVTTNTAFSFTEAGFNECIVQNFHLLIPVIVFELVLRLLMQMTKKNGEPQYPLLGPIYYCFITPVFYIVLWGLGITMGSAEEAGYFFPPLSSTGSVFNDELFDIFTEVHFNTISWKAVIKSIPTMISLTAFSLIHVPINIPAFAITTNVEPDMNAELIAHGYSNALAGLFGGLQNYMAYAHSVIYSKANGKGKSSSLTIVAVTIMIFIYGPTVGSYVPRCMAGTVLLHIGIDLFAEGVVDSYGDYDRLEYCGIWLITVVMVSFGMDAALVAGAIAALSTYAAQSIIYQDPIRGEMSATRLRSSAWNRCLKAQKILDGKNGRQRIFIIQLQGHIFFGNAIKLVDDIKHKLKVKREAGVEPSVVILDFTGALGLDTSAAQSIAKLKRFLLTNFNVEGLIFVTGQDGFPCFFDLSQKVLDGSELSYIRIVEHRPPLHEHRLSARSLAKHIEPKQGLIAEIPNTRVCETLDDALIFAEDVLIALEDPSLLQTDADVERFPYVRGSVRASLTSQNSNRMKSILETLFPSASAIELNTLLSTLSIEKYYSGNYVWKQGDPSESLKFVVDGSLISLLEDEHGATESIYAGSTIGELGLVSSYHRLTTVKVVSDVAILYSLDKNQWEFLTENHPKVARLIDKLVIQYLAHRVQHVSNNILDGRSLPV